MKTVHAAVVMHVGWEMDNEVWVKEQPDGALIAVGTLHGSEYVMSTQDVDKHIQETKNSLDGLIKVRELMSSK